MVRFTATITKIRPFGIFFDIDPFMIEGFIHISRIGNDYYVFNHDKNELFGERSGEVYKSGQKIDVDLLQVDLIMQTTEFRLIRKGPQQDKRKKRR